MIFRFFVDTYNLDRWGGRGFRRCLTFLQSFIYGYRDIYMYTSYEYVVLPLYSPSFSAFLSGFFVGSSFSRSSYYQ